MSSLALSSIVFVCLFAGALLGIVLRRALPDHHLNSDGKDTVKVAIGLIGTMGALVLGLMVSSAKSSYDTQKSELTQMSAKIVLLDRTLAHFGPETNDLRDALRTWVLHVLDHTWPDSSSTRAQSPPSAAGGDVLYDKLQELSPKTESQRRLQSQALGIATDIGQTRWLLFQQAGRSFSLSLLVVLVFWFTIIFVGFGLFAPQNLTILSTLLLCAVSVAGAILLILELDRPFDGIIQIASDPLHKALANLGH